MSRRIAMRSVVLAVVAAAAWSVPAAAHQHRAPARSSDFNAGWRFALGDPAGAQQPGFDDSAWRRVDLPHDWSIELDPTPEGRHEQRHGLPARRAGWYRKTFTLPRRAAGKQVSLEFDGVYMDSSVYVNGELAASHPFGYTGFPVDLTSRRASRASNVVAVQRQQPAAEQPLVLGQRHLPQRPPRRSPTRCTSPATACSSRRRRCRTRSAGLRRRARADARSSGGEGRRSSQTIRDARGHVVARGTGSGPARPPSAPVVDRRTRTSTRCRPTWSSAGDVVDSTSTRFGDPLVPDRPERGPVRSTAST